MSKKNFVTTKMPPAAVGAWLGYLVVDFLLHAVFLAGWWRVTESYWLPPLELFRRIPFGYTSFLVYCFVLTWLINRLYNDEVTLNKGMQFGAIAGAVFGVVFVAGTYSVFSMPPTALILWPLSSVMESSVAGGIAAWVLIAEHPWRQVMKVFGGFLVFFIIGIVIQNL